MLRCFALGTWLAVAGFAQITSPPVAYEELAIEEKINFQQQVNGLLTQHKKLIGLETVAIVALGRQLQANPANWEIRGRLHAHRARFHDHALGYHAAMAKLVQGYSKELTAALVRLRSSISPESMAKHRFAMGEYVKQLRELLEQNRHDLVGAPPGEERDALERQLLLNQAQLADFIRRIEHAALREQDGQLQQDRLTHETVRAEEREKQHLLEARGHHLARQDEAEQSLHASHRKEREKAAQKTRSSQEIQVFILPGQP